MTYPFLSDEWMSEAKAIREKYADEVPEVTTIIRLNQVVTDVPFGDGEVHSYLDTSSGSMAMELGELETLMPRSRPTMRPPRRCSSTRIRPPRCRRS